MKIYQTINFLFFTSLIIIQSLQNSVDKLETSSNNTLPNIQVNSNNYNKLPGIILTNSYNKNSPQNTHGVYNNHFELLKEKFKNTRNSILYYVEFNKFQTNNKVSLIPENEPLFEKFKIFINKETPNDDKLKEFFNNNTNEISIYSHTVFEQIKRLERWIDKIRTQNTNNAKNVLK